MDRKLRVLKANGGTLDWKLLDEEVTLVASPEEEYDFALCWKVTPPGVDDARVILLQSEPPLSSLVLHTYRSADKYHAFFCFDPQTDAQFSISSDPACYPYVPGRALHKSRSPSEGFDRRLFYAGKKGQAISKVADQFGCINIYGLRDDLGEKILRKRRGLVLGGGWPRQTKGDGVRDWRRQKQEDIRESNAGFVMAIENSILRNYVSEKIHDGFASDRVTCYLGAPNITELVPPDAFIDLRPFFSTEDRKVNVDRLLEFIDHVTEEQYWAYVESARKFREGADERHRIAKYELTRRILEVMDR